MVPNGTSAVQVGRSPLPGACIGASNARGRLTDVVSLAIGSVPTSARIAEEKCRQIRLAFCPFDITTLRVADGRNARLTNSWFGTRFGVGPATAIVGLQ
jgi:hypothetical protein